MWVRLDESILISETGSCDEIPALVGTEWEEGTRLAHFYQVESSTMSSGGQKHTATRPLRSPMRDANYEIETDYMNRMYFAYGYLPY